jgi:hypothetical protein
MKSIQKILAIVFVFLFANHINAQYGNQNGYGNQGGYGGNRQNSSMNSMSNMNRSETKKEIPIEQTVGKIVEKLKTELTLDALQEVAISQIFITSMKAEGVVMKKEDSDDKKIADIQVLSENTDRKIMELLNKDQKIKYLKLTEEKRDRLDKLSERRRK